MKRWLAGLGVFTAIGLGPDVRASSDALPVEVGGCRTLWRDRGSLDQAMAGG